MRGGICSSLLVASNMMNERELYQRRVYHYLMELRGLMSRCPIDVQTGVSEEVLTEVAHLLADGSIFDLVSELAEAQRSEEQVLYKQMMDLRSDQSGSSFMILLTLRSNLIEYFIEFVLVICCCARSHQRFLD
ncbi:unnamed protein product [Echinostoma caproni]|uniref:BHLH domain-containing protein n=1 Tax=Echinostoma caproni TaxID=27848 RepID=A0A183B5H4_9TREM|nr:unnamed protein product [Echinostoma caproni]